MSQPILTNNEKPSKTGFSEPFIIPTNPPSFPCMPHPSPSLNLTFLNSPENASLATSHNLSNADTLLFESLIKKSSCEIKSVDQIKSAHITTSNWLVLHLVDGRVARQKLQVQKIVKNSERKTKKKNKKDKKKDGKLDNKPIFTVSKDVKASVPVATSASATATATPATTTNPATSVRAPPLGSVVTSTTSSFIQEQQDRMYESLFNITGGTGASARERELIQQLQMGRVFLSSGSSARVNANVEVPDEMIAEVQMIMSTCSREDVITELRRSGLDVQAAIGNLLDRGADDAADDDEDDAGNDDGMVDAAVAADDAGATSSNVANPGAGTDIQRVAISTPTSVNGATQNTENASNPTSDQTLSQAENSAPPTAQNDGFVSVHSAFDPEHFRTRTDSTRDSVASNSASRLDRMRLLMERSMEQVSQSIRVESRQPRSISVPRIPSRTSATLNTLNAATSAINANLPAATSSLSRFQGRTTSRSSSRPNASTTADPRLISRSSSANPTDRTRIGRIDGNSRVYSAFTRCVPLPYLFIFAVFELNFSAKIDFQIFLAVCFLENLKIDQIPELYTIF